MCILLTPRCISYEAMTQSVFNTVLWISLKVIFSSHKKSTLKSTAKRSLNSQWIYLGEHSFFQLQKLGFLRNRQKVVQELMATRFKILLLSLYSVKVNYKELT